MHTYIAHDKLSGMTDCGGFFKVIEWSRKRIKEKKSLIVIIKCRPEAGGQVVAEIDHNEERVIVGGRIIIFREILKLSKRCRNGKDL